MTEKKENDIFQCKLQNFQEAMFKASCICFTCCHVKLYYICEITKTFVVVKQHCEQQQKTLMHHQIKNILANIILSFSRKICRAEVLLENQYIFYNDWGFQLKLQMVYDLQCINWLCKFSCKLLRTDWQIVIIKWNAFIKSPSNNKVTV